MSVMGAATSLSVRIGVTKKKELTIGLVQLRCDHDPAANLENAVKRIRQAADAGAEVVCLPELFRSQYFCQTQDPANFDLAEPIPGPTTERLGALTRESGIVLVASLFERRAPGVSHNTAVCFDADGTIAGMYRKMHI